MRRRIGVSRMNEHTTSELAEQARENKQAFDDELQDAVGMAVEVAMGERDATPGERERMEALEAGDTIELGA